MTISSRGSTRRNPLGETGVTGRFLVTEAVGVRSGGIGEASEEASREKGGGGGVELGWLGILGRNRGRKGGEGTGAGDPKRRAEVPAPDVALR